MAPNGPNQAQVLLPRDPSSQRSFVTPSKRIHVIQDVQVFQTTQAYRDIITFLLQLNRAVIPRKTPATSSTISGTISAVQSWPLRSDAIEFSEPVRRLQLLLSRLEATIEEAPPDQGPRRFGNISFRKWYQTVESRASSLLAESLSPEVLQGDAAPDAATAELELKTYLLGSFGNAQRLDYGTGHELSFLAFLACIWKLNGFSNAEPGVEERGIVLGVVQPYLELIRRLIKTYTLEPAGSHGVWGLDDHSFAPYIFGSAQLSPAISESDYTPIEGSLLGAPSPSDVAKANVVEKERGCNMYFSAIGFIYDVKKGPFWEHSPILFDISGVPGGWGKINKGMIKMYNAEVLSKFPVVQHFPFGSLLSWDSALPPGSATTITLPTPAPLVSSFTAGPALGLGTRAPWALGRPSAEGTAAPWAARATPFPETSTPVTTTRAYVPTTSKVSSMPPPSQATRAPWAQPQAASDNSDSRLPNKIPYAKPG